MFSTSADAQVTIFPASSTPGTIDHGNPAPTELGVQFKSDTTGYITGLRFYKATTNTGTHVAHLWTTSGVLLQSATFTNETASGWQQVNFATPVQVTANTVYIASYWAPVGHYSIDFNYFKTKGVDNAPLHALQNGVNGGNGVYFHASKSKFPSANYESSNFWVDVVYSAQATAANPQLSVSASTLSFGSIAVNSSTTASVTLTSSGTSPLTVNSAAVSGTGFSLAAGTFPTTLNPNSSMTLQVQFKPTASGAATGQLTIGSNSTTGSSTVVSLSGTGAAANPQLNLSWIAPSNSTDPVAGYNIYRALGSGAFQLVNSGIDTKTTYVDSSVSSGNTYNYLVKSVDQSGVESTGSNEISVAVP